MIALVVPLAMTTRVEVIRRKEVMTLIAGLILASMIHVPMMNISLWNSANIGILISFHANI